MTLSANGNVSTYVDQQLRLFDVAAGEHIYKDGFVGVNPAGYLKTFVPGDLLVGLAYEEKDNSAAGAADGDLSCRVQVLLDFAFALTGVTVKDIGRATYATSDNALAFIGHPDAFVGRVLGVESSNLAVIRLKQPGEKPLKSDTGSIDLAWDFAEPFTETGDAGGDTVTYDNGLTLVSALGLGVGNVSGANGGADLEFDAVAEIAQASIETPQLFTASKGVTFESRLHLPGIGDAAALDAVWGLVDAITANSRASMDHVDATDIALFHMDGSSANILAESDDGTTDVAPVDTTIDNVAAAGSYKDFIVIVRPSGAVEFWINGVRMLSGTTFAVASTAVLAGIVNLEKTSDDTTGKIRVDRMRVAGGKT